MPHPVRLLRFLYFIYARNFKVYYLIIFNFSEEKDRLHYEAAQPENILRKRNAEGIGKEERMDTESEK